MINDHYQNVLVTGATGFIGPKLVNELCKQGHKVRTLSIDESESGLFPGIVQVLVGDITDRKMVKMALEGINIIFHLAALLHILKPSVFHEKEYERINVLGTRTLVEAAVQAGVSRIVFFSTISVYGQSNESIVDESWLPKPNTPYSKTKLSAEKLVLDGNNIKGQPLGVVLRLGAVYGARVKGNYLRLVQSLAMNRFIPIGKGKNRKTLIYVKDVVKAAILVSQHPYAAGNIYNVTDGRVHTMKEITTSICSALGRKSPKVSFPLAPAQIVANVIDDSIRLLGFTPPGLKQILNKYCEDVAVDGGRIMREIEFRPEYDLQRGWFEAIQEMREAEHI